MSDSEVRVKFGASTDDFNAKMAELRSGLAGLVTTMNGVNGKISAIEPAAATLLTAGEYVDGLAMTMGRLGLNTNVAAESLSTSSRQIGYLQMLAAASGLSLGVLVSAFGKMDRGVAEGGGKMTAALAELHISLNKFRSESPTDQLRSLAQGMRALHDSSNGEAAVFTLLGQSGLNLLPILKNGPKAIDGWTKAAQDAGIVMSTNTAAALAKTHAGVVKLNQGIKGAGIATFMEFRGAIDATVQTMTDLVDGYTQAVRQGGALKDALDLIADAFKLVDSGIVLLAQGFRIWLSGATDALEHIQIDFTHMETFVQGVFVALGAGAGVFFGGLVKAAEQSGQAVGVIFENLGKVIGDGLHGRLAQAAGAFSQLIAGAQSASKAIAQSLKGSVSGFDFSTALNSKASGSAGSQAADKQTTGALKQAGDQVLGELNDIWPSTRASGASEKSHAPTSTAQPAAPVLREKSDGASFHSSARVDAAKASDAAVESAHAQHLSRMRAMDRAGAAQETQIAQHGIAAQIGVLRAGLRQREVALNAEVAQHRISANQKYAILEAETEKEYQAERALLEEEKRLAAQKPAVAQAIDAKIEALQAQHNLAMLRLDEQSIAASQRQWQNYFNTIESAFNGQIKGLIQGTTNWASLFKSTLTNLIVKFIETCEKMAFQWAATEIAKTTATTSGAAARAAAENSASAASMASTMGAILRSITASASETFAGIFGFLSPAMGPAAIGPAAAGQASVMAAASAVPAFAQGAWRLPSDTLAQVHRGEMIVPAAQTPWAQSLMANAASAGGAASGAAVHIHPTTNFHVSAIDSGSVAQWMKSNSSEVMKAMDQAVRHGAHLGLRRLAMG